MNDTEAAALLAAATGGCAPELAQRLMLDVVDALGLCEQEPADAGRIEAALRMMAAAAQLSERGNPLDAMLAAQMAAVHGAAMRAPSAWNNPMQRRFPRVSEGWILAISR